MLKHHGPCMFPLRMAPAIWSSGANGVLAAYDVTRRVRSDNLCFNVLNHHGCFPCDQIARAMARAVWSSGRRWGASCLRRHPTSAKGGTCDKFEGLHQTLRAQRQGTYDKPLRDAFLLLQCSESAVPKTWVLLEYTRSPNNRLNTFGPQNLGAI